MGGRRIWVASCAIAALAAAPSSASAATVQLDYNPDVPPAGEYYRLEVNAPKGERNAITLDLMRDEARVTDARAALTAGDGCTQVSASEVVCPTASRTRAFWTVVRTSDNDDLIDVTGVRGQFFLDAGQGDDTVLGSGARDVINGGAGDDVLRGRGGNDEIRGDGRHATDSPVGVGRPALIPPRGEPSGDDDIDGGTGVDEASYEAHNRPVSVDLSKGRGGQRGERDRLSGVESATGGWKADRLIGNAKANSLDGGYGSTRDHADGRGGADSVGAGRAIGGPGSDTLSGRSVSCGSGTDSVFTDAGRSYPADCERSTAGSLEVTLHPRRVAGGLRFTVFCTQGSSCGPGRLVVGRAERRVRVGGPRGGRAGRKDVTVPAQDGRVRVRYVEDGETYIAFTLAQR